MPDLHELLHTATDGVAPSFETADVRRRVAGRRRRRRGLVASAMVAVVVAGAATVVGLRAGGDRHASVVVASPVDQTVSIAGQWQVMAYSARPDIKDWTRGLSPEGDGPGALVTMTFWTDGAFSTENCNSFGGDWHQDNDTLSVTISGGTLMACSAVNGTGEASDEVVPGLNEFLLGPLTVAALPDDQVQLGNGHDTLTLAPYGFGHVARVSPQTAHSQAAAELLPAVGTWTIGPQSTSSARITFAANGIVTTATIGCDGYAGTWEITKSSLTVRLTLTTSTSCPRPTGTAPIADLPAFLSRPLSFDVMDQQSIAVSDGKQMTVLYAAPR